MVEIDIVVCFCALMVISVLAQDDQVCVFGEQSFLPGENLGDAFSTRCGAVDEWPCFCNPILPNSAECPYCGFSAGDGTLYCAKDGQNITFRDGSISRACTCEIPDDPTEDPIRECEVVALEAGCNWFDLNGNPIYFENGESFGDSLGEEGLCGPTSEWPSFCYVPPGSAGGDDFLIDYPYCVFNDVDSGQDLCARDGETVDYVNEEGTSLSCTCAYTSADGPNPTCERVPSTPNAPPPPTSAPVKPKPSGGLPLGIFPKGTLPFLIVLTSGTFLGVISAF